MANREGLFTGLEMEPVCQSERTKAATLPSLVTEGSWDFLIEFRVSLGSNKIVTMPWYARAGFTGSRQQLYL